MADLLCPKPEGRDLSGRIVLGHETHLSVTDEGDQVGLWVEGMDDSDQVGDHFPRDWLESVLPEADEKWDTTFCQAAGIGQ